MPMSLRPSSAPADILAEIVSIEVHYVDFKGKRQSALIDVNRALQDEVRLFFERALELRFPIEKVVQAGDAPYFWDDELLMADNATSGFNYRLIAGTVTPSNHSYGRAFDVNTRLNPYIRYVNGTEIVAPDGASWHPSTPGTLMPGHPLVELMESLGWAWGGYWDESMGAIDYQHFEKPA